MRRIAVSAVAAVAVGSFASGAWAAPSPVKPVKLAIKLSVATKASTGKSVGLNFAKTTVPKGDKVTSYTVTYGDGSKKVTGKGVPKGLSHKYSKAGTFSIKASITDAHKKTSTVTDKIKISVPVPATVPVTVVTAPVVTTPVGPAPVLAPVVTPAPVATTPAPVATSNPTPTPTSSSASPTPSPTSPSPTPSASGTLSLLAGRNRTIQSGPAMAIPIGARRVAVDSGGNIYIADKTNNVIEKVTPSGSLSIVAGNRSYGPPTPGPATASALDQPEGVAVASDGTLYIGDSYNHEVEKVTPDGTLSVFAGTGTSGPPTPGPATSSRLSLPYGVAVGTDGTVYVDDNQNCEIEKVSTTGTLSIIAGSGSYGAPTAGPATSSKLGFIEGLAVASDGTVYVADNNNNVVEKVSSSGTLAIAAGSGSYGAPTAGPATSSKLAGPEGVAVDGSGNIYVADTGNEVVEKVSSGSLTIVAGTGSVGTASAGTATNSSLDSPEGVAADANGNFWIADDRNTEVEKVTTGGALTVAAGTPVAGPPTPGDATSSALDYPIGVAVGSDGSTFIADDYNNVIEKVAPGGSLSIIAGNGSQGAPTAGPATSSALNGPVGVAVGGDGAVYISDAENRVIEKVTSDGSLSIVAGNGKVDPPTPGPALTSSIGIPVGIAVGGDGSIFIGDIANDEVEKITSGGTLSIIAGTGSQSSGTPTPGPATSTALGFPNGVAVGSDGSIYIADTTNNVIEKVTPSGTLSILAGNGTGGQATPGPATSSSLSGPIGVAVGGDGSVYVADSGNSVVEKVLPSGTLSIVTGSGGYGPPTPGPAISSALAGPEGIAVDSAGSLYIGDSANSDVEKVSF